MERMFLKTGTDTVPHTLEKPMKILTVLAAVFLAVPCAAAQDMNVTPEQIGAAIGTDLRHPYLFFSAGEKAAILARAKTDPQCRDILAREMAEANRLLHTPVETPLPRQLPDSRFDTSGEFLGVYYHYRNAAVTLAFVYQMTGEEKYARKSFEFAKALCDMDTWVIRACQFAKAYRRVSPWNVPDDKVVFGFAIVASDTASELAMVYDWLYEVLDREERDWIRGALLEKAITRVRGNYEYHWWATAYRCNWCSWCNTGLGLAALALLTEDPQLVDVVAESYNRISNTLSELGEKGGWAEGTAYWGQTFRMTVLFADALKRITGGKFDHFKHPKVVENTVTFPLHTMYHPRKWLNFADARGTGMGSARLYNKLAIETGSPGAAWMRENIYTAGTDLFDLIWPRHTVEPALPDEGSMHFPTIGWAVLRRSLADTDGVVVACKAGKNDDPHHGHLDVGQFMVYRGGEAFIADIGTAVYDERYFDAEKYDTPHADSRGHNLIFVNGEQQVPGKRYRQPLDESVGGEILAFRDDDARGYVLMDPTKAFPGEELGRWRRHIVLDKDAGLTLVVDEVRSVSPGAEVEARFHSDSRQSVRDGYTLLDGSTGDMALIPVTEEDFTFRPSRHAYLALQKQASFTWIPYNGTVVRPSGTETVICHFVAPVDDDADADRIARSAERAVDGDGNLTVSIRLDGGERRFTFERGDDGLVLR